MKLKLTFPRTYIDPYTGDVAKTSKDTIDGGNKLYINYDAKTGKPIYAKPKGFDPQTGKPIFDEE